MWLGKRGTIFDFGRSNRLGLVRIVSDEDLRTFVGWWLSGRILGRYVSVFIPSGKPWAITR